jgi:hypothetical protein
MWNLVSAPSSTSPTQTVLNPRPTLARARGGCSPRGAGFGWYFKGSGGRRLLPAADAGTWCRATASVAARVLQGKGGKAEPAAAGRSPAPLGVAEAALDDGRGRELAVRSSSWPVALRHHRPGRGTLRCPKPTRTPGRAVAPGPTGSAARRRRAPARWSVTAARRGRQTDTPTPSHGNHRTSVRQGRDRVEMSSRGRAERRQECGARVSRAWRRPPGGEGSPGGTARERPPEQRRTSVRRGEGRQERVARGFGGDGRSASSASVLPAGRDRAAEVERLAGERRLGGEALRCRVTGRRCQPVARGSVSRAEFF